MSSRNLGWFIFFWFAFTSTNIYISVLKPYTASRDVVIASLKKDEPKKQDTAGYINLLEKLKVQNCTANSDKEDNTFYKCSDGSTASMIHWTRGRDRKGVVTREYDSTGKLTLIYGHPDDVY